MQKLISFVVATLIVFGSAALGFHLHANVQIVAQPSRFLDVKIERSMAVDDITWQEPKEVQQDFFTRDSDFYGDVYGQERDLSELPQDRLAPKQYQVGTVTKGPYAGNPLFVVFGPAEYTVYGESYWRTFRFIRHKGVDIVLAKYADDLGGYEDTVRYRNAIGDAGSITINPLETYTAFALGGGLILERAAYAAFGPTSGFLVDANEKPVFTTRDGAQFFARSDGALHLRLPDGTGQIYELRVPFWSDEEPIARITWLDGSKNKKSYESPHIRYCEGWHGYRDVVYENIAKDLKKAGVATSAHDSTVQEIVYTLPDSHSYMREQYDELLKTYRRFESSVQKPNYEQFIKNHAIFFWKDPFGRILQFTDTAYRGC